MKNWLLLLTLFAFPVYAQDPPSPEPAPKPEETIITLDAPDVAEPAQLIRVTLKGVKSEAGNVIFWDVICGDQILDKKNLEDLGSRLILSGNASKHPYRVRAFGTAGGKAFVVMKSIFIGEPTPPTPPTPPVPVPTLAQLAGKDAGPLGQLYAELLASLGKNLFDDLAHFYTTEQSMLVVRELSGNGAKDEITKRLKAVVTLSELKPVLESIVAELGQAPPTPPTPPVPSGERHMVILHEVQDDTPEQARLWTQLRTGANAEYIKTKNHRLDILDDDSVDANGNPAKIVTELKALGVQMPALFILDKATGSVIHSQPLPDSATKIMEVLKTYGG